MYIWKRVLVDRSHVCDGDTLVVFVNSGFVSAVFCLTLKSQHRA